MKRAFVLSYFLLSLLNVAAVRAAEPDKTESAAPSAIKGRVSKFISQKSGKLPRLSRPQPAKETSVPQEPAANSSNEESGQLKSRVFQAAGLQISPLADDSERKKRFGTYGLNAREIQELGKYDIAVLIDGSGSMRRCDCDALDFFDMHKKISRWEWCKQQTKMLSMQMSELFPAGITVIPFASYFSRFNNVSASAIESVFNSWIPGGGTRLDRALEAELDNYFSDRACGRREKPLLLAVITDGVPNRPEAVTEKIIKATRQTRPGELRIVFFLIGHTPFGYSYTNYLCNLRENEQMPFNIVSGRSFDELNRIGLPRSLLQSILSPE